MNFKKQIVFIFISALFIASSAWALPPVNESNLVKTNAKIKYWNVQSSGSSHSGSVTQKEGYLNVQRGTVIQPGSLCHNYGSHCQCGPAKFRITPSTESKWHVIVKSGEFSQTSCPSGISPTSSGGSGGGSSSSAPRKPTRQSGKGSTTTIIN